MKKGLGLVPRFWICLSALMGSIVLISSDAQGQNDSLTDRIFAVLILDSLTVSARQNDPDIKSMIARTIHDTTFYRAFQRLRRVEYTFSSELYFYHPEWKPFTFMRSQRTQHIEQGVRTHEIIGQEIHSDMLNRKGDYIFYTASLYDRIFFTNSPTGVPKIWTDDLQDLESPSTRMEKYVRDLKRLLFAPGTQIDLPLMGDKTAIFTPDQMKKYNFSLVHDSISYSSPVYKFQIRADSSRSANETVIKNLTTVFDRTTKQVLNRTYQLTYQTLLYSFDVHMFIRVEASDHGYIPTHIEYKGWWKVPFKKPEWCRFVFKLDEY